MRGASVAIRHSVVDAAVSPSGEQFVLVRVTEGSMKKLPFGWHRQIVCRRTCTADAPQPQPASRSAAAVAVPRRLSVGLAASITFIQVTPA